MMEGGCSKEAKNVYGKDCRILQRDIIICIILIKEEKALSAGRDWNIGEYPYPKSIHLLVLSIKSTYP